MPLGITCIVTPDGGLREAVRTPGISAKMTEGRGAGVRCQKSDVSGQKSVGELQNRLAHQNRPAARLHIRSPVDMQRGLTNSMRY
ncbi:MAG: hypothetical protein LAT67_08570 [Balneolales bacterium]|nr:hypothetical protein [Balneolales bacterium]